MWSQEEYVRRVGLSAAIVAQVEESRAIFQVMGSDWTLSKVFIGSGYDDQGSLQLGRTWFPTGRHFCLVQDSPESGARQHALIRVPKLRAVAFTPKDCDLRNIESVGPEASLSVEFYAEGGVGGGRMNAVGLNCYQLLALADEFLLPAVVSP